MIGLVEGEFPFGEFGWVDGFRFPKVNQLGWRHWWN